MSIATLSKRLSQIEEKLLGYRELRPCHQVVGHSQAEIDQKQAALISSGVADAADRFIQYRVISPERPWG